MPIGTHCLVDIMPFGLTPILCVRHPRSCRRDEL